ncbi:MAG TPA: hypothetical protein VN957_15835, partial [Chthoniobacterales bacterium]|nr:hypothetical protein [Chthoniobacterales bacterium]
GLLGHSDIRPEGVSAFWLQACLACEQARIETPSSRRSRQPKGRYGTKLDLYTQEDRDETLAAQGEYLTALGVSSSMAQSGVGWIVG